MLLLLWPRDRTPARGQATRKGTTLPRVILRIVPHGLARTVIVIVDATEAAIVNAAVDETAPIPGPVPEPALALVTDAEAGTTTDLGQRS